jgi:hypothetical protein
LDAVANPETGELSGIDKLDMVARAAASKIALSRARLRFTLVSLFVVSLAIFSEASRPETVAVWVMAVLWIATTVLIWWKSRYAALGLAILFLTLLVGGWFFRDPDDRTLLGSAVFGVFALYFFFIAYGWWTNAAPFMAAHSKDFENERIQVTKWMNTIRFSPPPFELIEFSSRSFVRGYWTYRLLNTGYCWMIARYKTGNMNRWLTYRVLDLEAVHVTDRPGEKLRVRMGNRTVEQIEISREMRDRLLRFVTKGNWSEIDPLLPGSLG